MPYKVILIATAATVLNASPVFATEASDVESLQAEITTMKQQLKTHASQFNVRLNKVENSASKAPLSNNSFNPKIGLILQGRYQKKDEKEGFSLGEVELNLSTNIDDKFKGRTTIAFGERAEVEEAYIETLTLPYGSQVKAGRFLPELGYINAHHAHVDDFSDRPLANTEFLEGSYKGNGLQLSTVLPTELYTEIGTGIYDGAGKSKRAWSAYARVGGDIGHKTSWRLGLSTLQKIDSKDLDDTELYIADVRMVYAPTGNNANQEIIFQAEYFAQENERDASRNGWYAQSVYKFSSQWRTGVRVSQLDAQNNAHKPQSTALMLDWSNSEFSRVRLQFNQEESSSAVKDNQVVLHYVVSLGAHASHAY